MRATGRGLYLQDLAKTSAGDCRILLPRSIVAMLVEHRQEQLDMMVKMGDEWVGWEFDGRPVALIFSQRNGRPIDARMDTQLWKALQESAGLVAANRYRGRHTAASHMVLSSGGDAAVAAKVLGHSNAAFTYSKYVHPLLERERMLMDQMDAPAAPYAAPYGSRIDQNGAELIPREVAE